MLLEHTLVLSGETVSENSVWQGWPNEALMSLKEYREHMKSLKDHCKFLEHNEVSIVDMVKNFPPLSRTASRIGERGPITLYDNSAISDGSIVFESLSEKQALLELSARSGGISPEGYRSTFRNEDENVRVPPLRMRSRESSKRIEEDQYITCLKGFFCSNNIDDDEQSQEV